MNPLVYSLCQKPVIGAAMWISSLCAFPPLFQDQALPLATAGATVVTEFTVSIDKRYPLVMHFDFPSVAARLDDTVVGSTYNDDCRRDYTAVPLARRENLGRPMPIHVVVRHKGSGVVAIDEVFDTLCLTSHAGSRKTRTAGMLALAPGSYVFEARNVAAQPGLEGVKTSIALVAGQGK